MSILVLVSILVLGVSVVDCQYEVGTTYNYFFETTSNTTTKHPDKPELLQTLGFSCIASVFCTSVHKHGFEFKLKLTGIRVTQRDSEGKANADVKSLELDRNFSKPFIFTILRSGNIGEVKHAEGENQEVIDMKAGIVSQFIVLGENETDEHPVETLDNQGIYHSHWKREKRKKSMGKEMVEITRRYTHEDFIYFKKEDIGRERLADKDHKFFLINVSEKKKIGSGMLVESTSEHNAHVTGKEKLSKKAESKTSNGDKDKFYNGPDITTASVASLRHLSSKLSSQSRTSSNSRSWVKHNDAESDSLPMKPVAYFSRDFYTSRAQSGGPTPTSAPRRERSRLGELLDLGEMIPMETGNEDYNLPKCNLDAETKATFDVLEKTIGTHEADMPYIRGLKSPPPPRRHTISELRSLYHSEPSSFSPPPSSSLLKPSAALTNDFEGIRPMDCPDGLDNCYKIGGDVHHGEDSGISIFVQGIIHMGTESFAGRECKQRKENGTGLCNYHFDGGGELTVHVWDTKMTIFKLLIEFTNIDGFARRANLYVMLFNKKITHCRYEKMNCITYSPYIPSFSIMPVDTSVEASIDWSIFTLHFQVGFDISIGLDVEFKICPFNASGGVALGPFFEIWAGAKFEVKAGILGRGGAEVSASIKLSYITEVFLEMGVNQIRTEGIIVANPFLIKVEAFAYLFHAVGGTWTLLKFTIGEARLTMFRAFADLPWIARKQSNAEADNAEAGLKDKDVFVSLSDDVDKDLLQAKGVYAEEGMKEPPAENHAGTHTQA